MKIEFNKFNSFYKDHKPSILAKADEILSSGHYIRDNEVKKLEEQLAKICDRKYAITTSSCTDALFLSLVAAGVGKGDEVILTSFSYIASLSPILMCGATPVFIDTTENSFSMNFSEIEKYFTNKTKAIIYVQLFGISQDISLLTNVAQKKGIAVIEDSAQALGSCTHSTPGAKQGDLSCISFDPTKIVSAFGTGGAILTDNLDYLKKLTKLVHHGRNEINQFDELGYNSKIPALNAALISMQLDELDFTIKQTNNIAHRYLEILKDNKYIQFILPDKTQLSSFHKLIIMCKERDLLSNYLKRNNIETRIHYDVLLHEQPLLSKFNFVKHSTKNSEFLKTQVLSLPIYLGLSISEIDYICTTINEFYKL
ncbi:MAG: DegT/DnrJ/EryC1/StrS family aminotransferase [Bacteroidales bacterium]|nr:DegT/DnrJ/EryC1/StrS family aminotransferase [Bacteroidales bacterium]